MGTTDQNNTEEKKDTTPAFVKDPAETENFGDKPDTTIKQENYPDAGNQTQTGAATNNSELDIEPTSDEDGEVFDKE